MRKRIARTEQVILPYLLQVYNTNKIVNKAVWEVSNKSRVAGSLKLVGKEMVENSSFSSAI